MNIVHRHIYVVILAILLTLLLPLCSVLAAPAEYEYYATGDNASVSDYGVNWFAQTFNVTGAHTVTSVRLKLYRVGSPGTITASLRETDSNGHPTSIDLTSGTYNGNSITTSTSGDWYSFTMTSEYSLEAGKKYAVVVSAVAGDASNYACWRYRSDGAYTAGNYEYSTNGGVSWSSNTNYDFMFDIYGNSVMQIIGAKVFSSYLEKDDWLITVYYKDEYPPYYGSGEPASKYFDLQLLVGSTVVAQIKLPDWGCKPAAIYLSKAMADTLEWGSSYTVRLYGTFGSNPTASYTLTSTDWLGADLKVLDDWVLQKAELMQLYYDTAMTTFHNNVWVLNEIGGFYFAAGIPSLELVRPNLFLYPPLNVPYSQTNWTYEYETEFNWEALLGPKIASDAASVGDTFGITGKQAAQIGLFGTWAASTCVLAATVGTPAVIISLPILAIGIMTGLIPLTALVILMAVFVLVIVWVFWLRST